MKPTFFALFFIICLPTCHADGRVKIYSILEKPIFVNDTWAGQSFTLIKEDNEFLVSRHFIPSGMQEGKKIKYPVRFKSDYQLRFNDSITKESFTIGIDENSRAKIFLNGLEIAIR